MENKKTTPKIAIILLNYNNYEDTFACVESLQRVRYPNVDIIIVDNKSTNDSLEKLYELKSENIKIVDSGKNGGFAFGNNMGMKIAREENSDYVLLLNNDTIVTENFLPMKKMSELQQAESCTIQKKTRSGTQVEKSTGTIYERYIEESMEPYTAPREWKMLGLLPDAV